MTLDGVGPWPPIQESHVEMDGAWALYEAWVKLQIGDIDTALVYCYGKSSPGPLHEVLTRQLDPYYVGPAVARRDQPRRPPGPGAARRRQGHRGRLRRGRRPQPAQRPRQPERPAGMGPHGRASCSPSRPIVDPLRKHDCPPITDGACRRDPRRRRHRPRARATARRGSAASTTASSRWRSASATSRSSASTRLAAEKAGVGDGRSTSPSCTRRSATRS